MTLRRALVRWGLGMRRGDAVAWRLLSQRGLSEQSASVKEEEVEKFRTVDWWDRRGKYGALHDMNPIRCKFIRRVALEHFRREDSPLSPRLPLQERTVLDVGCGGGILSEALGRFGGEVTGIDIIQKSVEIAEQHVQLDPVLRKTVNYRCVSAEALVEEGATFDVVVASEVIEHVQNPAEFIRTLSQLMTPDGLLCMTTLNRTLPSLVLAIWMAEYVVGMVPAGTHEWSAFVTPGEMTAAVKRCGLKLHHLTGMNLNPITNRWWFSQDTSINYAAAFKRESTKAQVS